MNETQAGRVIGIGGVFFKSQDPAGMRAWYSEHLGLTGDKSGVMFPWLSTDQGRREHVTVWSIFPADTTYFGPGSASLMMNYIVDDIDALLERLTAQGVRIDPKREDCDYGRFAWIYDPDGNKIELWQPPAG
jgi:catechol 2,3-dioxygenase-like lactoylglutathione lyase family enzyme